jgi:hypothetical protein
VYLCLRQHASSISLPGGDPPRTDGMERDLVTGSLREVAEYSLKIRAIL